MILFIALGATAQTTNALSDKEIQGRQLAQKLLDQQPTESFTNTGVLKIRDSKGQVSERRLVFSVIVTKTSWTCIYNAFSSGLNSSTNETLWITHKADNTTTYEGHVFIKQGGNSPGASGGDMYYSPDGQIPSPFAESDFLNTDLGLEFLHWPGQKILRGDTARGRLCKVLESTNPNPSTNGYSRVLCWIDNETLGIVEAEAYDAKNKKLKEFLPKNIKKVNGQWQVGSMEIDNVQTGSRTKLEFDLKAK